MEYYIIIKMINIIEKYMKVILKMIYKKEKEYYILKMVINMKVNGKMVKVKERV